MKYQKGWGTILNTQPGPTTLASPPSPQVAWMEPETTVKGGGGRGIGEDEGAVT